MTYKSKKIPLHPCSCGDENCHELCRGMFANQGHYWYFRRNNADKYPQGKRKLETLSKCQYRLCRKPMPRNKDFCDHNCQRLENIARKNDGDGELEQDELIAEIERTAVCKAEPTGHRAASFQQTHRRNPNWRENILARVVNGHYYSAPAPKVEAQQEALL